MEEKDYLHYVKRIEQIDHILKKPVETIINIVIDRLGDPDTPNANLTRRPLSLPSWTAEDSEAPDERTRLTTAVCCSTLQRLWRFRRRFPSLKEKIGALADKLKEGQGNDLGVLELLAEPFLPSGSGIPLNEYSSLFLNKQSGSLDPLTASQIFWVLLNAGESKAHTGVGFLAVFTMLWSMYHRFPDPLSAGASMPGAPPTAYVTAKCIAPLQVLCDICRRRADYLNEIARILTETQASVSAGDPGLRYSLALRLEELSTVLYEMSHVAINPHSFRRSAQELEGLVDSMEPKDEAELGKIWGQVVGDLETLIRGISEETKKTLIEARPVVDELLPNLRKLIEERDAEKIQKNFGLSEPVPKTSNPERLRQYWDSSARAAEKAESVCKIAMEELLKTAGSERNLVPGGVEAILATLKTLAAANRRVERAMRSSFAESVQWCEQVVLREIAHATAGNLTEFDPAELVGGLATAVISGSIDSPLDVESAVEKALIGSQEDGSWRPGQPFFIDLPLSLSAPTSDALWMLTGILARFREVRIADRALEKYVNWLERTRIHLAQGPGLGQALPERPRRVGWVFERALQPRRIDLWATALAINALLEIRDHMEARLWEICESRFKVIRPHKKLRSVDAVDLGAKHKHRLHRRLTRMARQAAGDDFSRADYSLILHGPPGSSKTAITEAFAAEVWRATRREAKLIRITPADFTRQGEDRMDSEARIIFDLLQHIRGVTVLFDEIDDLLRRRDPHDAKPRFMDLVVPAMLNRLQDLRDRCSMQEIHFILATNYIDRIEPALIRKGRIDEVIPLVYPDWLSRQAVLYGHAEWLRKRIQQRLETRLKAAEPPAAAELRRRMTDLVRELFPDDFAWTEDLAAAAAPSDIVDFAARLGSWVARLMAVTVDRAGFGRQTRFASWKTVDDFCHATAEYFGRFLEDRAQHGNPQAASFDWVTQRLQQYDPPPAPQEIYKWKRLASSKDLKNEFLCYMLAGAEGFDFYLQILEEDLRGRKASLGEDEKAGLGEEEIRQLLTKGRELWQRQERRSQ